jgi:hypothetical protein
VQVSIAGRSGWITQSRLAREPFNGADQYDRAGKKLKTVPLPDRAPGLELIPHDGTLAVDNGRVVLHVDPRSGLFLDFLEPSSRPRSDSLLRGNRLPRDIFHLEADSLWVLAPGRRKIYVVDPVRGAICDSIAFGGIGDPGAITDFAKSGGLIYIWGLAYEYEACPLAVIDLAGRNGVVAARSLTTQGGLLARLDSAEAVFIERTGRTFRVSLSTGVVAADTGASFDPKPYRAMVYDRTTESLWGVMARMREE